MGGNPDREPPFFFMKPADSAVSAQDFGRKMKQILVLMNMIF